MSEIVCDVCQGSPREGIAVYRINEKGVPGIWRCKTHLDTPVDPVVFKIGTIIEDGNNLGDQPPNPTQPDDTLSHTALEFYDFRAGIIELWTILDDIDTASDQAKGNDQAYRNYVEKVVKKRFRVLTSDGYQLYQHIQGHAPRQITNPTPEETTP